MFRDNSFVNAPTAGTRANASPNVTGLPSLASFRQDWQDGLALIRAIPIIAAIVIVSGVTTLGGAMMDPLFAPFADAVLQIEANTFGWILTVRGIGGILGGILIGQLTKHLNPAYLFSLGAVTAGLILFIMFQTISIPLVFVLYFILGIPAVGAQVGLQTLFQQNITDAYRGRVGGITTVVGSTLELFSVSVAGIMGEIFGIVPMLLVAASMTILAGVVGFWLFPRAILSHDGVSHPAI